MKQDQLAQVLHEYAEAVEHACVEGVYLSGREIREAIQKIAEWVKADPSEVPSIEDCRAELQIYDAGMNDIYFMPF